MKLKCAFELYKEGKITLMKAAEIAGVTVWEFLEIVRAKKIPMYYTLEDVKKDIESAERLNY